MEKKIDRVPSKYWYIGRVPSIYLLSMGSPRKKITIKNDRLSYAVSTTTKWPWIIKKWIGHRVARSSRRPEVLFFYFFSILLNTFLLLRFPKPINTHTDKTRRTTINSIMLLDNTFKWYKPLFGNTVKKKTKNRFESFIYEIRKIFLPFTIRI